MQLYLDSFGAYLSVRDGMFLVRTRSGGEQSFAARKVAAIVLTAGTALSADAALLAAAENIPLLLIDAETHAPLAQLGSGRSVSLAAIRRNQALYSRRPEGFAWTAELLARKIDRQAALLENVAGAPQPYIDALPAALKTMSAQARALRRWQAPDAADFVPAVAAERFRGQEGTASRVYFQQLALLLDPALGFEGRQGRPAYDPFNAVLNYLYGMMYTSVHLAALKCGLDPYMAVLHADQYGATPTLAFDLIEPFRPWADRVALRLAALGVMHDDGFFRPDAGERGLWLDSAGKGTVIDAMLSFMQEKSTYEGREVRHAAQIDLEAQQFAAYLQRLGKE